MATTLHGKIPLALLKHVQTYADANPIQVSWPNVDFDPPTDETYLDVAYIPNSANAITLQYQDEEYLAFLQITIVAQAGGGTIKPHDVLGQVADHFKAGTDLFEDGVGVCVYRPPFSAQGLTDGDTTRYPLTIPIRVLT